MSTPPKKQQKAKTNMILGVGILLLVIISVVLVVTLSGKDKINPVIASIDDAVYREAINKDYTILASGSAEERARLIFPSYGLCLNDESVNSILAEYGANINPTESDKSPSNGVFTAILARTAFTPKNVEKCDIGYKVTYEIEAPDLSDFIEDSTQSNAFTNLSDFSSYMFTYIANSEVKKYEVGIEYTEVNGSVVGNYQTPEFVNAVTGDLLEVYREGYQELLESMMEVDK